MADIVETVEFLFYTKGNPASLDWFSDANGIDIIINIKQESEETSSFGLFTVPLTYLIKRNKL